MHTLPGWYRRANVRACRAFNTLVSHGACIQTPISMPVDFSVGRGSLASFFPERALSGKHSLAQLTCLVLGLKSSASLKQLTLEKISHLLPAEMNSVLNAEIESREDFERTQMVVGQVKGTPPPPPFRADTHAACARTPLHAPLVRPTRPAALLTLAGCRRLRRQR
jgi:hypothetical protein